MPEWPKSKWKNECMEAWVLEDGSLMIKLRIDEPCDGEDHYFMVDTLEPTDAGPHTTH